VTNNFIASMAVALTGVVGWLVIWSTLNWVFSTSNHFELFNVFVAMWYGASVGQRLTR